jgi:formate hydrogenlyase subunit 6/NADH:ubiquinone oxidoreductase subunit I
VLNILRRSLRTGSVTIGYPATPDPAPETYRGQVLLDAARCVGDGACARICPSAAIIVRADDAGWLWELDDARCVFCGLCAEACPTAALALSNDYELATRAKPDLQTRVAFVKEIKP